MTMWLKQSTSAVVSFGPFLDKTDGVTLETAIAAATLDHVTTGIMISKAGGVLAVRNGTPTATAYDAHGMYRVTLNTTDTATLGTLRMVFTDAATHLPVWQDFMVVTANAYDALFAATGVGIRADVQGWLGTAPTTPPVAGEPTVNTKTITTGAITETSIATAAITAAKITALSSTQWTNLGSAATNYSATRGLTGTALPAVAAGSTGGAPVIGTTANTFKSDASANVTFANTSIATVTNLTNAPTSGDLTATMKTSVATAVLPTTNAALNNVEMLMVLASDHATPATGLSPTLTRSIDGGAFGAIGGTTAVAEVGSGIYQIDLDTVDTNGLIITYKLAAATADDSFLTIRYA